jgi:hypothetical protein
LGIRGKACKRIREFLGTHYEEGMHARESENSLGPIMKKISPDFLER